ncbi:MAG: hypothetical protein EXR66_02175 [Dehalococcoidia bacterium]|nr:hypothetical protein [Dehalococcoidia bacterium]
MLYPYDDFVTSTFEVGAIGCHVGRVDPDEDVAALNGAKGCRDGTLPDRLVRTARTFAVHCAAGLLAKRRESGSLA